LGINGTTVMAGRVDDVLPEVNDPAAVFSKYVTIKGRNYGRDLARLFITKNYANWRFDDLIDNALSLAGSEITYTSPGTADYVDADFKSSYLQNGFAEAAQRLGYDFNVKNDKSFEIYDLTSPPGSGVLLKALPEDPANNILLIYAETKEGFSIYNYVQVTAGGVKDHWTEMNRDDLTGVNCGLYNDTTEGLFVSGAASIKAVINEHSAVPKIKWIFPLYNHNDLDYTQISAETCSIWCLHNITGPLGQAINVTVNIYIKDTNGSLIVWTVTKNTMTDVWTKHDFVLGINASTTTGDASGIWDISGAAEEFNWHIAELWVEFLTTGDTYSKIVWVDGLELPSISAIAIAEDATSQTTYRKGMIPISRTDVKSQVQLQEVADAELVNRKDVADKLNLTCTFQPSLLYAGYLVDVLAPYAYIGSGSTPITYRIISVRHTAEPGTDLCKGHDAITELELVKHDGVTINPTRYKLVSASAAAISISHENRLRVIESSLTGVGAIVGSGGGGGSGYTGHGMFPVTCEVPTYVLEEKEPYLWGFDEEGNWTPVDLTLPLGDSFIRWINEGGDYIDVALIITGANLELLNPTLYISQSMLCKKDFAAGGMLTSFQGALNLGSGLTAEEDMPQIILAHAGEAYGTKNILELWEFGRGSMGGFKCEAVYANHYYDIDGGLPSKSDTETFMTAFPHMSGDPADDEVLDMLMDDDWNMPNMEGGPEIGGLIQFNDTGEGSAYTSLYAGLFTYPESSPCLITSHHLIVRKDFMTRGVLKSYEGAVVLKGGLWDSEPICGWGPSSRNPFIQLSDTDYPILEIVKYITGTGWQHAGLKCGIIYTDSIKKVNGDDYSFPWSGGTVAADVEINHAGTCYLNVDSSDSGTVQITLQQANSDKLVLRHYSGDSYLSSAAGNMYLAGASVILQNDGEVNHSGTVNFNLDTSSGSGGATAINLQHSNATKLTVGTSYTGSHYYAFLNCAGVLNLNGTPSGGDGTYTAIGISGGNCKIFGGYGFIPEGTWGGSYYEGSFVGNSGCRFNYGYMRTVYTTGGGEWDEYDDLAIVKQWGEKNPVVPSNYDPSKKKPVGNDPFVMFRAKEGDDYFNLNKLVSFGLGCSKALAKKQDEYDAVTLALYGDIEKANTRLAEHEDFLLEVVRELDELYSQAGVSGQLRVSLDKLKLKLSRTD
jgi:hypothetical protein